MADRIETITEILEGLTYTGYAPDTSKINSKHIGELLSSCSGKFINEYMLKIVISDEIIGKELENINLGRDGTITKEDIKALAVSINERIYALPEECTFYFIMPRSKLAIPKTLLGPRATIFSATEDKYRPTKQANEADSEPPKAPQGIAALIGRLREPERIYNKGDVVLEIKSSGLMTQFSQIKLNSHDPFYLYKIVLYLLEVQNTFESTPDGAALYRTETPALTYGAFSSNEKRERVFHGDSRDYKYLASKQFNQKLVEFGDLTGRFGVVKRILGKRPGNTPKYTLELQRQLRNAAYWSYESLKAAETHSRVVLTCTALDALLGSRTEIKEQKAEIISQSISSNILTEQMAKDTIVNLYTLRNEIIHGTKEINTLNDFGLSDTDSTQYILYHAQQIMRQYFILRAKRFNN